MNTTYNMYATVNYPHGHEDHLEYKDISKERVEEIVALWLSNVTVSSFVFVIAKR